MKKIYLLFLLTSFIGFSQSPGDLIITEIMNNPAPASDQDAEYFEILNLTSSAIDMNGWIVKDDGSNIITLDSASMNGNTIVPANGYFVFGRSTDMAVNAGAPVDYQYGGDFTLGNGSDEVVLVLPDGTTEIARVDYDNGATFPDLTGESMQLDPAFLNANDYSIGTNWCPSSSAYGDGGGALGTPGMMNDGCTPTCQTFLDFTPDTACDSVNPGDTDDTYTISLDYNGAATGETFVVSTTPSGLTIGGDDPTSVADGTITISGVQEGTDITITVSNIADGGLCDLSRDVISPVCAPAGDVELELQGIIDFGLSSSDGKAVHLVATADITDLSEYSVAVASNGGGSFGASFTFPNIAVANGEHILLARNLVAMEAYMTTAGYNLFDYQFEATSSVTQNGDDAIGLFKNANEVEVFGDPNVDGTGEAWEYSDSWAYKNVAGAVWPMDWVYGAVDCTEGTTTIFDSTCVYPFLASLSNNEFTLSDITVFPNPVRDGFVNIISNSNTIDSVEIFDMMGRNVYSNKTIESRLDVSSLNQGVYIMKITSNSLYLTTKLIVN